MAKKDLPGYAPLSRIQAAAWLGVAGAISPRLPTLISDGKRQASATQGQLFNSSQPGNFQRGKSQLVLN